MPFNPKHLIFYAKNDAFGDALLKLPALRAARTAFPNAHITYATLYGTRVDKALAPETAHLIDTFDQGRRLRAILKEKGVDGGPIAVVDCRIPPLRMIATRFRIIGRNMRYEANVPGYFLSWRPSLAGDIRPDHSAWRYHHLVERLAKRVLPFDHVITPGPKARALATQILGENTPRTFLLGGNGAPDKHLSQEQITTIAKTLLGKGLNVIFTHTPGMGTDPDQLARDVPQIGIVSDKDTGGDVGLYNQLLLALGGRALGYAGMEGGMGHLMAAAMTPMVIINRGFSMRRWRPLSLRTEIIDAPDESTRGHTTDVPPDVISAAIERLLSAAARDHQKEE